MGENINAQKVSVGKLEGDDLEKLDVQESVILSFGAGIIFFLF